MDDVVARSADHECLPPFGRHDRCPCRLVGSGLTEPGEFGHVVDHHGAGVLTQLAPAPHEPVDNLLARVGNPDWNAVGDDRARTVFRSWPVAGPPSS